MTTLQELKAEKKELLHDLEVINKEPRSDVFTDSMKELCKDAIRHQLEIVEDEILTIEMKMK